MPLDFLGEQSVTASAPKHYAFAKPPPAPRARISTRRGIGSGLTLAEAIMKRCTANTPPTTCGSLAPAKSFGNKTRSKKGRLIQLLSNPKGARVLSLCKSLGWQKHTVRAAISGLRTAGYVIEAYASSRNGVTVYKLTGKPDPEASA